LLIISYGGKNFKMEACKKWIQIREGKLREEIFPVAISEPLLYSLARI